MKELDLYKFCQDKEMRWHGDKLYIWIRFYDLREFTDLIGCDWFDEGGEDVSLQYDCICMDLVDICDNHEIDPERIFAKRN
ncbi:hypothetical protein [Cytobacillus praedii]|uniref:Uncharacterized protein n=1 Tax=Cytobacillus praedii TaxID=1742358 RepID=A0A4R1ARC1_9BACI|nr:hypothetical protein [Cytobacillus praedii]TCI99952.1 hypothetical protein E0Y62_27200 [Cytobacillus praedii]